MQEWLSSLTPVCLNSPFERSYMQRYGAPPQVVGYAIHEKVLTYTGHMPDRSISLKSVSMSEIGFREEGVDAIILLEELKNEHFENGKLGGRRFVSRVACIRGHGTISDTARK
jgi:hypothetical protein